MNKFLKKYSELPVQVKASFWFLICAFLEKGISVITTPIFTRIFSTEEYGKYSIFNSWLSVLTVFISWNLYGGVFSQGLVKFENKRKEFCSSLQGLSLILFLVWLIFYLLFNNFINKILQLTTFQVISMLLMIWTSSIFNFWATSERVEFKYKNLIILTIFVCILKPILGIFLVINSENKVSARIFGLVIVNFFAYIGLFITQLKQGKKFYDKKNWIYVLKFNFPLIPHYLANSILNNADRIMIGKIVGTREAGIYSLAYSVSLVMGIFNTALLQTIEPWLFKKLKEKNFNEMSKVMYPSLIGIGFLNIIFIALAPEAIKIFAPVEYMEAIFVIPPVAMSNYFMFSYIFFAVFEFYYEKTKYIAVATFAGALLNVILNYICINIWGYLAAGYTTLICFICYALLHFYFMKKICKNYLNNINIYGMKKLFLISIMFVAIGFIFLISYTNDLLRYSFLGIMVVMILMYHKMILKKIVKLVNIKNRG